MLKSKREYLNRQMRSECQYLMEHGVRQSYIAENAKIDRGDFNRFIKGTLLSERSTLSLAEVLERDFKWRWRD